MKNSGRSDRQQMRAQMDSLNKGVENILSFEQKEVYRKLLEERSQRQRGGNHGGLEAEPTVDFAFRVYKHLIIYSVISNWNYGVF